MGSAALLNQTRCKALGSSQAHLSRAPCVAKPRAEGRAVWGSHPGTCGRGAWQAAVGSALWPACGNLRAVTRHPGTPLLCPALPCAPPELQHHVSRDGAVLPPQLLQVAVELLPRWRIVIKAGDLDAPHIDVDIIRECNLQAGRGSGQERAPAPTEGRR